MTNASFLPLSVQWDETKTAQGDIVPRYDQTFPPERWVAETAFVAPSSSNVRIVAARRGQQWMEARVEAGETTKVAFHAIYFPGWTAYVDGEKVPIEPSPWQVYEEGRGAALGVIRVLVPEGSHLVTLVFEDTPVRLWSKLLSVIGVVAIGIVLLVGLGARRRGPPQLLSQLKAKARRSKYGIIARALYANWRAGRRLRSGDDRDQCGSTHNGERGSIQWSLDYIDGVFSDYSTYSGLPLTAVEGKRVLEVGPGDNFGVALRFLMAGARQVVCLDRFYAERDTGRQLEIYRAMRERLDIGGNALFDELIDLTNGAIPNPERLVYLHGTPIEKAQLALGPDSFDLIVSRAVLEHVYDPDASFRSMDRMLRPGGFMIHRIDFRDHGMFSLDGHHALTFLTVPEIVYRFMTSNCGSPNRRLVDYYQRKMKELNYQCTMLATHIVGVNEDLVPHKSAPIAGVDYPTSVLPLLGRIRPRLQPQYQQLRDDELLISGIFLTARKPL